MPDFYAHQVFGQLVFDALPGPVQKRLTPELPGYRCGLYGPDPLFFYHPMKSNPVSAEGHRLHAYPPQTVLERYRTESARRTPYVLGYAAGFFCHYLLDSLCHPIVNAHARGSSLRHAAIEGAFDRSLISSGGSGLPFREPEDPAVYIAAALGYTQAGPEQFKLALRRFCQVSRLTARLRRLNPIRASHREVIRTLNAQVREQAPGCAGLVARLTEALERGEPLDFLPSPDFNGREPASAIAIPAVVC